MQIKKWQVGLIIVESKKNGNTVGKKYVKKARAKSKTTLKSENMDRWLVNAKADDSDWEPDL